MRDDRENVYLKLFAFEDEALLIGRYALLVLNFFLDLLHGVPIIYIQRDYLPRQGLDKDLKGHGPHRRSSLLQARLK